MAVPKRKSNALDEKASKDMEDKDSDILDNLDFGSDDEDDTDSSVYSELEDVDSTDSDEGDDNEEGEDGVDSDETGNEEKNDNDDNEDSVGIEESKESAKAKGSKTTPSKGSRDEGKGDFEKKDKPENEYEYDSSDEEDIRNTVGNIPINWYDDYDHLGYDLDGKHIRKPKRGDELDHFLRGVEDGNAGITVRDPSTGQDVVLSAAQVDAIKRLRGAKVPDGQYDLYEDMVPWFSSQVLETPVRDLPESKRSFLPSLDERRKVGRMVHAIKMGWMKTKEEREREQREKEAEGDKKKFYMLWKTDGEPEDGIRRIHDLIPAPKMRLPDHAESYNPPPEYLFTEQERERWEELAEEPHKRRLQFVPAKHDSLRKVPAYKDFIKERFERCLDLYLAPRARKMRLTIQPEDLLPQMPKAKDLQPFPTACALTYRGHANMVRTVGIDPTGQFLASGSDDGTVKVWEIQSGYCLKTFVFHKKTAIRSVEWCPNKALCLLAVAMESSVLLINASVGDKVVVEQTDELVGQAPDAGGYVAPDRVKTAVTWASPEISDGLPGETRVVLTFFRPVKQVTWHAKGDYLATVLSDAQHRSVLIHQLSRWRSQVPFGKPRGLVQCVRFHPTRPYFFMATQRHVRVYNLVKQDLSKKLKTNAKWISSLAVHPKGDNVLVGTYDKRVQWFDLDLSTLPYRVLRYHHAGVRQVGFHRRYPLFASCADDASIIVSHGMVYGDLLQNPFIVPVKLLRGHTKYDDFGVMDLVWHPTQPWLFSAGADGHIKLWA